MAPLFQLPEPRRGSEPARWHQLTGSLSSLAVAEAAARDTRPWLVVENGAQALEQRLAELRFYAGAELPIWQLPDWEMLPYDHFSPHPDLISERLRTLAALPKLTRGIVLLSLDTLPMRLAPRSYIESRSFQLRPGERLELQAFRQRLIDCGYAAVGQVSLPGEFALRGSLLDLFPMGSASPLRIDLLDDEIETIRRFDPQSQRSLATLQEFNVLPGRELPLDPDSVRGFRKRFRARFEGDPTRTAIYRGVSDGLAPPGIEYYLPLFFDQCASLADYLPPDPVLVLGADWEAQIDQSFANIVSRYEDHRHDIERPLLPPAEIALPPDDTRALLRAHARLELHNFKTEHPMAGVSANLPGRAPPELRLDARAEQPLAPLLGWLKDYPGRVLLAVDSAGRREVLTDMLRPHGIKARKIDSWRDFVADSAALAMIQAPELRPLTITEPAITILTENQLFGARARQERRRRRSSLDPAAILRDLQTLTAGAPVVHELYGVGRFLGLIAMEVGGQAGEFLAIEYRDGDRIYAPVHALHLVSRYGGADVDSAPWHKLGTDQWARAKRRAAEQVRDVAAELLDLYARRKSRPGLALPLRELEYQAFANTFPFEETADQAETIRKVLADLQTSQPMDRIVCGDVGFGKTEVAMRAAFAAAQGGKQVAVLVPTTLLAQQHYNNFRDRFADWPIRIELLSRFRSDSEADQVVKSLEAGQVDIVIATHRLLHAQIRFKDLGLIIVDEEHRFGVRDKEKLRALRAEVHMLTLTATPIPRTLNMALGGLRELSIIATPPAERVAVRTFVGERNDSGIREAVLRELRRGGQVYFVHNEVKDIEKFTADLTKLLPEAQIRFGHGQMRERDLEQLMVDFYHRRFNVLVCTTIIESGIDVPTANTILIDRADRFGLAQLHQLRGRVGRSHHAAYAYLLIPPRKSLTRDAVQRLEAIESLEDLGAGFVLATHDLEIRGAGELLGDRQSGELAEVGVNMYLEMLDRAVQALKSGREPELDRPLAAATEIELRTPALLPEIYIADVHLRLTLYKRIAAATADQDLDDLHAELIDRFGPLPPAAKALLDTARLRLLARVLGVRKLELGELGGYLLFEAQNQADPRKVIARVQKQPHDFKLDGALKLRILRDFDSVAERFEFADRLLRELR
jgi:transcription-repair coupling factor (superfamily II helicase)